MQIRRRLHNRKLDQTTSILDVAIAAPGLVSYIAALSSDVIALAIVPDEPQAFLCLPLVRTFCVACFIGDIASCALQRNSRTIGERIMVANKTQTSAH